MTGHELVQTTEGAWAVRDTAVGEVMHPVVGPLVESHRMYVGPSRLSERLVDASDPLVVYDVGLGAGSNAVAARAVAERQGGALVLRSFDRTADGLALAMTRPADFGLESEMGVAARALVQDGQHRSACTRWTLHLGELPSTLGGPPADIVFWDPFSPRANPELWSVAAFTRLRACCGARCTVHTYSAATSVRSALLLAGFFVGRGSASGSRSQSTVAATDRRDLTSPLTTRFLDRLSRSSKPLPADAPADAIARIAGHPQFMC